MDGCGHGAGEIGHAVVRVGRAVRPFAVDHGGLQGQLGDVPVRLDADVAPGRVDDARALGRLQRRRAEQRFQRERHAELAYRAAPPLVTQPDPQVGRRERERRSGGRRRRADGPHLDLGAERRPRCDLPFDREAGAPEEEGSGVAEGLEARLQVAGDSHPALPLPLAGQSDRRTDRQQDSQRITDRPSDCPTVRQETVAHSLPAGHDLRPQT